jgi:hypothetical protein
MKLSPILAGLLFLCAPAVAQDVDVGTGDWSAIPVVQPRGLLRMSDLQMDYIERIGAEGRCNVPGLGAERIDISVPFLIRYGPDGSVQQVVVRDLSCPELEVTLGAAVLQLARQDEYRPRGSAAPGWYRSVIAFANE